MNVKTGGINLKKEKCMAFKSLHIAVNVIVSTYPCFILNWIRGFAHHFGRYWLKLSFIYLSISFISLTMLCLVVYPVHCLESRPGNDATVIWIFHFFQKQLLRKGNTILILLDYKSSWSNFQHVQNQEGETAFWIFHKNVRERPIVVLKTLILSTRVFS